MLDAFACLNVIKSFKKYSVSLLTFHLFVKTSLHHFAIYGLQHFYLFEALSFHFPYLLFLLLR